MLHIGPLPSVFFFSFVAVVFNLTFVYQVFPVLPAAAANKKKNPTRLSIPDTKSQSSHDILRMARNCCAACQHVKARASGGD